MNLVYLLRSRQTRLGHPNQGTVASLENICKLVPDTKLHFGRILDHAKEITNGHVILGFTWDGHFLLSYKLNLIHNDGATDLFNISFHYYIYWWIMDLQNKPLKPVHSVQIFKDHYISDPLILHVYQSNRSPLVTIYGHIDEADTVTCYVSVVTSPMGFLGESSTLKRYSQASIHMAYKLYPPFPLFRPKLCLAINDSVLINTGSSLFLISHNLCPGCFERMGVEPKDFCCHFEKQLLSKRHDGSPTPMNQRESTLKEAMEIHAHWSDTPQWRNTPNNVIIEQRSLDLEVLVYEILKKYEGVKFRALFDYDIQLLEVNESKHDVLLVAIVIAEILDELLARHRRRKFNTLKKVIFYAFWNVIEGRVKVYKYNKYSHRCTKDEQLHHNYRQKEWRPGMAIVKDLLTRIKPHHVELTEHVLELSNDTVNTGISLRSLHHPHLPIKLVLN